jgi:prevent-host-death family protein
VAVIDDIAVHPCPGGWAIETYQATIINKVEPGKKGTEWYPDWSPFRAARPLYWTIHWSKHACMNITVSDAKGLLTDLVRRAEHGEEVVLTRHGRPVARLVAIVEHPGESDRRAVLDAVRAEGREKATAGPSAERSQDFLYDENGLSA